MADPSLKIIFPKIYYWLGRKIYGYRGRQLYNPNTYGLKPNDVWFVSKLFDNTNREIAGETHPLIGRSYGGKKFRG